MEPESTLTESVREALKDAQPFRPLASFDPNIDRITVLVRDCSITEVSNRRSFLTLFKDNHEEGYAGFAIDFAYLLCLKNDLIGDDEIVSLSKALDMIAGASPEDKDACAIAQGICEAHGLATVAMKV